MVKNSLLPLAVPNIEKYTTQYFEFKKDIFSSFNQKFSNQAFDSFANHKNTQPQLIDNNFLPHLLSNNQGFITLNKSSFFADQSAKNSHQESFVVNEKFNLPRICAHYNIKTQEELKQIDEANRKLLAINEDNNFQTKTNFLDEESQSIAPKTDVTKINCHSLKRSRRVVNDKF